MTSVLKLTRWVSPGASGSLLRLCSAAKSTMTDTASDGHPGAAEASPKPFSDMPGEKGWPLVGVVSLFSNLRKGKVGKERYQYQQHVKYGPVFRIRTVGNHWIVFASGPEAAAAMFRAEGNYPSRGMWFEKVITDLHKKNNWPSPLIFSYGENWKRIRSAVSKQVIPRRVGNLTPLLCEVADDLLAHLEEISSSNNGRIEDILQIMTKWAFQGTANFVFGENLNVYDDNDTTQKEFISAGLEFIKQFTRVSPLAKFFPSKSYREFLQATSHMRELGKQIMEKKVLELGDEIAKGTVDETKAVGILEQWLIEGKLEPEDALTQACDLLAAGLDTTKNTSTFLLFELAKQPALQDQLYHEIKAVLGDKANPSWEDLQNIPLVRYCLKETLRLYPAIQVNLREIREDAVLNGYKVPAGTTVMVSHGIMSISEEYFDQPDKFIPERWSKSKEESVHPFISLPFGFGQRGCYGRRLAELEVYILLTKMIPRYHLTTDKDSIKLIQATVLKPDEPVPIIISKRTT